MPAEKTSSEKPGRAKQLAAALRIAHTYFSQGMLDPAEKILRGVMLVDPKNAYAYAMLGAIEQQREKYEESIRHYSAALLLFPDDFNALTNRGEVYLLCGRMKEAAADFQKVSSLDPEGRNPYANRARLLARMAQTGLKILSEVGADQLEEAKRLIAAQLE